MKMATRTKTNEQLIHDIILETRRKAFQENKWGERHFVAWLSPTSPQERMIKGLILAWAAYADEFHKADYAEGYEQLADDGYASEYWIDMGRSIIGLLSMDLGRYDGGTLDHIVREVAQNEGFTADLDKA